MVVYLVRIILGLHIAAHNQWHSNFFFRIMFSFGFQYLVIIYINFKFNLNLIKYYIHGG